MLPLFFNRGAIIVRILNRYTKISLSTYTLLHSSVIFAINCYRGEYRLVIMYKEDPDKSALIYDLTTFRSNEEG